VWFVVIISLFSCRNNEGWQPGKLFPKEKLKIGVIYISDAGTETSGYTYAHKAGIEEMRQKLNLSAGQFIERSNVFEGILKTNEGGTVGSEGSVFSTEEIVGNIHWYYHNVIEH
jgi:hypothetical protein